MRETANFSSGVVTNLFNLGIVFISYPIFLNYLGAENFGFYSFLLTISAFLQLGNLGIGPTLVRYSTGDLQSNRLERVRSVLATVLISVMLGLVAGGVILFFFSGDLLEFFRISSVLYGNPSKIVFLTISSAALSVMTQAHRSIFIAWGSTYLGHILDSATKLSATGSAVILALIHGKGIVAVEGYIIGQLVAVAAGGIYFEYRRVTRFFGFSGFSFHTLKEIFSFAMQMNAATVLSFCFSPVNRLVITRWIGLEGVPVYDIAHNVAIQLRNTVERGMVSVAPRIAGGGSALSQVKLIRQVFRIGFMGLPVLAAIWWFVYYFAEAILLFWLRNQQVEEMVVPLRLMLAGSFVAIYGALAYHVCIGTGKSSTIMKSNGLLVLVNACGLVVLTLLDSQDHLVLIIAVNALSLAVANVYMFLKVLYSTSHGVIP